MLLSTPFVITPRLLPGCQIGAACVSIEYSPLPGDESRVRYRWHIDLSDGAEFSGDDLQSGCCGGSLQQGFDSLLSFLGAFAESVGYTARTGRESENADLFPIGLADWATENSDEFAMLQSELEESPDCIVE